MKRIGTRVANRGKKYRELLPERVRGLASNPVGCRFNSSVPHYFQPRFNSSKLRKRINDSLVLVLCLVSHSP